MNINKKVILASIGGVLLLLLVFAGVMLFRGIHQFGVAEAELVSTRKMLDGFYRKNPFPSAENVKVMRQNVKLLEEWMRDIGDLAKRKQVEPDVTKSPSAFVNMLSQVRNDLHSKARKSGVAIDPDFAFGFGPYFEGQPATADFVPRLIQQLIIVDGVCSILIEEKAKEIHMINRELFDGVSSSSRAPGATPRTRGRGGRVVTQSAGPSSAGLVPVSKLPPPAPDKMAGELIEGQLASKMKFVVEFSAKEISLINILNKLARSEMFIVVTSVDIEAADEDFNKEEVKADVATAAVSPLIGLPFGLSGVNDAAAEEEKPKPREFKRTPSRQERVVCGGKAENPARIRIELEIYRFK